MNKITTLFAAASLGLLAACGGSGDDATGDIVAADADAAADSLENQADATSGAAADALENQADAVREAGAEAEEAIDDADVETNNPAATAAQIENQTGLPTSNETMQEATEAK